jgi:voltage-gated potassium channel
MSEETVAERTRILNAYSKAVLPWMSTLALVYLVAYSAQSIWHDPQAEWYIWVRIFSNLLWVLFALDLLIRFILTTPKRGFFRKNWLDTITVILPQFRALRALRAFSGPTIFNRSGKSPITGRGITTAIMATVIIVWVGSLMVLNAERDAKGATITNFGDALWWAMETITTVGYGDVVPVTSQGRFFATGVMLLGISVLGAVTAWLSASLMHQTHKTPPPAQEVLDELAELKSMVASLQAHVGAAPTQPKSDG